MEIFNEYIQKIGDPNQQKRERPQVCVNKSRQGYIELEITIGTN